MPLANMMVFAGNACPRLAVDIAVHLNLPLGKLNVGRFSDGERQIQMCSNIGAWPSG